MQWSCKKGSSVTTFPSVKGGWNFAFTYVAIDRCSVVRRIISVSNDCPTPKGSWSQHKRGTCMYIYCTCTYCVSSPEVCNTITCTCTLLFFFILQPIVPSTAVVESGEPSDGIYQNMASSAPAPPRKPSDVSGDGGPLAPKHAKRRYENISSSSIGGGSADGDEAPEKKKPVPRTRNSLRNRGGGASASSLNDHSPPLPEGDEQNADENLSVGRGESSSPDSRNAPSPKPKPRAKRNWPPDGRSSDSDISSEVVPPKPPVKPYHQKASSPSLRGAPPEPPPKVPKTTGSDLLLAGKKKPIPVPPRQPTPEKRLSVGGNSSKRSSTASQERTEVSLADEDPYGQVDRTQFTDTGPSIQVLDESSGKSVPLEFVEKELEAANEADTSKSSILDTVSI